MDFNSILNYLIPTVIAPFGTEFVKKILKIDKPVISYSIVIGVSIGAAYLMALVLQPQLPMRDVINMALECALMAIGLKTVHKTIIPPAK